MNPPTPPLSMEHAMASCDDVALALSRDEPLKPASPTPPTAASAPAAMLGAAAAEAAGSGIAPALASSADSTLSAPPASAASTAPAPAPPGASAAAVGVAHPPASASGDAPVTVKWPDAGKESASAASADGTAERDGAAAEATEVSKRLNDMRVFRPSSVPFDPRRLQLPDDFYAPTQGDVATSMNSLSGATRSMADAPLMTKKMRAAETARKMSRFRKVLIRVVFPDRVALQGTFVPQSTVGDIVKFVRGALRDKGTQFRLFVVPPKMILKDMNATLWSEGFVPAALVNIEIQEGSQESSVLLRDDVLAMLEDAPLPSEAQVSQTAPPVKAEVTEAKATGTAAKAAAAAGKVPKWFKQRK